MMEFNGQADDQFAEMENRMKKLKETKDIMKDPKTDINQVYKKKFSKRSVKFI